jgi:hypothetical protein
MQRLTMEVSVCPWLWLENISIRLALFHRRFKFGTPRTQHEGAHWLSCAPPSSQAR